MKLGLNVSAEFRNLRQNSIAVAGLYIMLWKWIKVCNLTHLVRTKVWACFNRWMCSVPSQ